MSRASAVTALARSSSDWPRLASARAPRAARARQLRRARGDLEQKLDLTAARTPEALVEVMLADAFMLATPGTIAPSLRVLDVGSGAGAPALPLLILRSDLTAVLVEPLRKRVAFLRTALGTLGLVDRVSVREQKLDLEAEGIPGEPPLIWRSRERRSPQ